MHTWVSGQTRLFSTGCGLCVVIKDEHDQREQAQQHLLGEVHGEKIPSPCLPGQAPHTNGTLTHHSTYNSSTREHFRFVTLLPPALPPQQRLAPRLPAKSTTRPLSCTSCSTSWLVIPSCTPLLVFVPICSCHQGCCEVCPCQRCNRLYGSHTEDRYSHRGQLARHQEDPPLTRHG